MAMLRPYPAISKYWDSNTLTMKDDLFAQEYADFSGQHKVMAEFFVTVWNGNDAMQFGIIEAVRILPESDRQLIADWLAAPFFPT